jgi:hypothetical protein
MLSPYPDDIGVAPALSNSLLTAYFSDHSIISNVGDRHAV